ncbi:TfuA-like protein [Solwaraspora sp. WMMD406]|uniref:TfuA-like protein n=1 Tax=Solwaraspora sp. WMMD406 TaxID=3016095 RepID=UPI0024173DE2|nr:TfuA-like protein [Solwaraspora sp. WMMD406]MDG4766939.1 TfuA-like protein [Solwaraspora sp. WMMD406]
MTVHVFLGPTLSVDRARELLPTATFLPPVSQGDVLRSTARRPSAIGIVDGRFHDVPAVWHKEIMWAISRGIPVYGSASMGALRAAELAPFGMRGVGEVFDAYHSGALNDDDEVAVAHGDAEDGYQPLNEAMVNIRATLALAVTQRVLTEATAAELERIAKATYYLERGYPQMLLDGAQAGLPTDELDALRAWLPGNRVNQKARDAEEMLRLMAREADVKPAPATFTFEHTAFFEQARQTAGELSEAASGDGETPAGPAAVNALEILDELRLDPVRYRAVWERAGLRAVVDGSHPGAPDNLPQAAARFRRERGLTGTAETREWLTANDLDVEHFGTIVGIEQRVRDAMDQLGEIMPLAVVDLLRVDGEYAAMMRRIIEKREILAAHGLDRPADVTDDDTTRRELRWYFDAIGQPQPEALDSHWRPLGFADQRGFLRAVRREFNYRRLACSNGGRES